MSATGGRVDGGRPAPTSGSNPDDTQSLTAESTGVQESAGSRERPTSQGLFVDKVFSFSNLTIIIQLIERNTVTSSYTQC
jgi:hypothetical protein